MSAWHARDAIMCIREFAMKILKKKHNKIKFSTDLPMFAKML